MIKVEENGFLWRWRMNVGFLQARENNAFRFGMQSKAHKCSKHSNRDWSKSRRQSNTFFYDARFAFVLLRNQILKRLSKEKSNYYSNVPLMDLIRRNPDM
ncbi:MAG: hypothetical protein ABSF70_15865 [Terracidiphilus sp.]|jgi:hypothetical protein